MNAPISRVLPTPVANAKQTEGNSRSKSVTVGNSLWMAARAVSTPALFPTGMISVMRSRISRERRCGGGGGRCARERRCGGRRLRGPAMALTCGCTCLAPCRRMKPSRACRHSAPEWRFWQIPDLQGVIIVPPLAASEHVFWDLLHRQVGIPLHPALRNAEGGAENEQCAFRPYII